MKKKGDSLAGIIIGMGGGVKPLFCAVSFRLHDHRAVISAEAVPSRGNGGLMRISRLGKQHSFNR